MTCSGGDSAQGADEAQRPGLGLPAFADRRRGSACGELLPSAATVANPLDYTAMIWGDSAALCASSCAPSARIRRSTRCSCSTTSRRVSRVPSRSPGARCARGSSPGPRPARRRRWFPRRCPSCSTTPRPGGLPRPASPRPPGCAPGSRCAAAMRRPAGDPARAARDRRGAARAAAEAAHRRARLAGRARSQAAAARRRRRRRRRAIVAERDADAVAALAELGGCDRAEAERRRGPAQVRARRRRARTALGAGDVRDASGDSRRWRRSTAAWCWPSGWRRPGSSCWWRRAPTGSCRRWSSASAGSGRSCSTTSAIVPLPAGAARVERALRSLRGAPLLDGGRGRRAVRRRAPRRGWRSASASCLLDRALELIELNPVLVVESGAVAVDAAIRSRPPAGRRCRRRQRGTGRRHARRDRRRRRVRRRHGGPRGGAARALGAAARGARAARRPHLDGGSGRPERDRVRRRLGALAPAAHVVGDHAGRPAGVALRTTPSVAAWYVGERAPRGDDRRARRDRPPRLGRVRRRRADRPAQAARPAVRDRRARALRPAVDRSSGSTSSSSSSEERDVLAAELESLAHAPLDDAGAVSVLRWHALSGYSLALTQFTGGRVTIAGGTRALLEAIAAGAPFEHRLGRPPWRCHPAQTATSRCRPATAAGVAARAAVVAVPINALGGDRVLAGAVRGQARRRSRSGRPRAGSRSSSARGAKPVLAERDPPAVTRSATSTPRSCCDDGTQLMIGFGIDAERCDATDLAAVQRQLDEILPGYEVLDATAHDWLADEFSRGHLGDPPPGLVRAPPRRDAAARGPRACWPDRTSPTAGRASSTGRSSRACGPEPGRRR